MNPDQVIALTSVISGGVVGLGGLLLASSEGAKSRRNTIHLADRERHQKRIEDAYIALLGMVQKTGVWVANVRPIVDTDPPSDVPPLPDLDSQIAVMAKVRAYASRDVMDLHEAWSETVKAVIVADRQIGMRRVAADEYGGQPVMGSREFMDYREPWHRLEDTLRPAENAARKALSDQVAHELNA